MLTNNKLIYRGYWVLITIIFLYDTRYLITKAGLPYFFVCGAVRIALLVAIAWLNLKVLVPRYLLLKRYLAYFGQVLLLIIGYLLVQSLYDYYLFGFIIGPGRGGQLSASLVYNFTHTSLYLLLTVALKFSIDWYEQKKQNLQAEVNYLRSQLNPHFLFNALNNLYALTIRKSDQAPAVVLKLSGLMEYMLYESAAELVPLEKELNYLRNYLDLERLRHENDADIQLIVSGDVTRCSLSPFLLLPLVENAVKHGAYHLHINIEITDTLMVRVINNKPDFQQPDKQGGLGLVNLKKRLELLYPHRHALQITDSPIAFIAELKINLSC